jgi:hypothetical protein
VANCAFFSNCPLFNAAYENLGRVTAHDCAPIMQFRDTSGEKTPPASRR